MNTTVLFIDGSVSAPTRVGYGAYLSCAEEALANTLEEGEVVVKRFEDTSSSELELQTLLWALAELQPKVKRIRIYTDSQNIVGLPARRQRLEKQDYNNRQGKPHKHQALYRQFFDLMDQLDCEIVKVRGHQATTQKDLIDRLFTRVDRAARSALRAYLP